MGQLDKPSSAKSSLSLVSLLCGTTPRETAGSVASSGFSFQHAWALSLLLELHSKDDNYLMLLDYFDDVAVADDDVAPTSIAFYQVKGRKNGTWTIKKLLAQEKNKISKGSSIVGKLYRHFISFGDFASGVYVVSNLDFNLVLRSGASSMAKPQISLSELSPVEKAAFESALKEELEIDELAPIDNRFHFLGAKLHYSDYKVHLVGKLATFLSENYVEKQVDPTLLYRVLIDEVGQRSNRLVSTGDFIEIVKAKGISRKYFGETLARLPNPKSFKVLQAQITAQLQNEGVPFRRIRDIVKQCEVFEVMRMDVTNTTLSMLVEFSNACVEKQEAAAQRVDRLIDRLDDLAESFKNTEKVELGAFTPEFCMAVGACILYGY